MRHKEVTSLEFRNLRYILIILYEMYKFLLFQKECRHGIQISTISIVSKCTCLPVNVIWSAFVYVYADNVYNSYIQHDR